MSFGSSRSTRIVSQKTKQPGSPSRPRNRPYSSNEKKQESDKQKRTKALGLNYLRSTNGRQPKQSVSKVSSARTVMESIKKIAKSGSSMNLKKVFKRLDLDGNGVLDRQEFRKALAAIGIKLSVQESSLVFDAYDPNGTGEIDYEEFLYSFFNRRKLVTGDSQSSTSAEILEPADVDNREESIPEKRWNAWNKVKDHVLSNKDLSMIESNRSFSKTIQSSEQPGAAATTTTTTNSSPVHSRHWDAVRKHVRRHSTTQIPEANMRTPLKKADREEHLLSPLSNSLKHIIDLKNKGFLSDIEFKHAKAKLLGIMPEAVELLPWVSLLEYAQA